MSRPGARPLADTGRAGAYLAVLAAAVLWGTWSLFLRPSGIDARWSTPIVFATMVVFGMPLLARRGARTAGRRSLGAWGGIVVLGIGDAANAWLFFNAMGKTTVAIAVLSHYLAPSLVAIIAPWIVGTARPPRAFVRAAVATAGLALLLEPWRAPSLGAASWIGAAFGAGSAVFYAVNVCVAKRIADRFTSEEQLVFHSAVATPIVALLAPWGALPSLAQAGAMVAAGAIVGVTAAVLFVRGIARVPAEHAAVITFFEPLTAVAVGSLAFGERFGAGGAVGGAIVVATGLWAAFDRGAGQSPRTAR